MRILVIHNPTSGKADQKLLPAVLARLRAAGCEVRLRGTAAAGDAAAFAAEAVEEAFDRLVIAGGDGTINEVLNGLKAAAEAPALALIPVGTANVLAVEIALPLRAEVIAETILEGDLRPLDLGEAGGQRFILMAGVGFDAHVVAGVSARLKAVVGKGAYVWSAIRTLIQFDRPEYRVTVDGEIHRAGSLVVAKSASYAGRFILAPAPPPGHFQVCLFAEAGAWAILRYGLRALVNRLDRDPGYRVVSGRQLEIVGPIGDPVQLDGDAVQTLPISIRVVPNAVRLAFPARDGS